MNNTQPENPPVRLYTPTEAADYLSVKESWLRRKVTERAIAHTFLGKHLRFSTTDLQAIVASHDHGHHPPRTQ